MPTITELAQRYGVSPQNDESAWISKRAGPVDDVELLDLPWERNHWQACIVMYDANGDVIEADSTGEFDVEILPFCSQVWDVPTVATIDATAPVQVDWAASTVGVRVTPTGLTDTDTWEVRLVAARS